MSAPNIYAFFDEARVRPGMYFGGLSLAALEEFCHGYYSALRMHHIVEEAVPALTNAHFGAWLYRRHGWSCARGWAHAIRSRCADDEEAFRRFLGLMDQYRTLKPVRLGVVTLGRDHKPTGALMLGSGAWPLPPQALHLYQYRPEEFYFLVELYRHGPDDRGTFTSVEAALALAERLWQVRPEEWERKT